MISGVAFCPQAPALVPDVGRGAEAELGDVRAACRAAIRHVAVPGTSILLIGAAEHAAVHGPTARGSFAGYGVDLTVALGTDGDGPVDLPPSLAVGAWLIRDALGPDSGATGFATTTGSDSRPEPGADVPTALVVVGDGSARRSEKAPGYLDPRAEPFDAGIRAALAAGDATGLAVDPATATELLVAGAPAWAAVARMCAEVGWTAELLYEGAPLGVGYFVAAWTAHETSRG